MDYGKLIYKKRDEAAPKQFSLPLGSTTLGREADNGVVLDADGVSRYHARIICTPTDCTITDLESTNGTFLNQVRLQPNTPMPLRSGDKLRIGVYAIAFVRAPQVSQVLSEPPKPTPQPKPAPPKAAGADKPQVIPPDVASKLPAKSPATSVGVPVRRLPGNLGPPPRFPPSGPRYRDDSGYMRYLPPIYHEQDFLRRFLLIFESILTPVDRTIDQISSYFDPRLTPESFLPWLASWVDLVLNEKWPIERRRALIGAAAELYRWRGTRRGLSEFIRIYAGVEPSIVEPGHERQPGASPANGHMFHVQLDVPNPDTIDRALVEAIIEAEKPAHTSYTLDIRRAR
jgi:phage tail-like protein